MIHPFEPIYDRNCKILLLGTFPSSKSRENGFYYGHPQNRFWKVISALCSAEIPMTNEAKKALLVNHHIALWDVLASCEIVGSSDAAITKAIPNDLSSLIKNTKINLICFNGRKAESLFRSFTLDNTIETVTLPSTSAANAVMKTDLLIQRWIEVLHPILFSPVEETIDSMNSEKIV